MARSKVSPCPGKPKAKPATPDASSPVVQRLLAKEQRRIEAAYSTTSSSNRPAQPVRKIPGQKKGVAYKFTIPKKGPREELEILPAEAGRKRKARSPESEDEVEQDSPVGAVKRRKRDDEAGSAKKEADMMKALEDAALDAAEKEMEKRKENVKANVKEKTQSGNAKAKAKPQQKVKAEPPHKMAASSPRAESEE